MAIFVDEKTRVLIQGITGREGLARAQLMKDYGTNVVAGVTPGRGGQDVCGISVYESFDKVGTIDASVIFVPAPLVKNAALEALAAGVKLLVIVPDRVPIYDVLEIVAAAKGTGARFVGPNTLGLLSPGKAVLGMIGGGGPRGPGL
jgi:succinyl-CoA synthetase alpha subunit